ncbi:putative enoyl-CoA hydratase echA12 [Corynebacterium provencense]|uniref:Putative enoyl-CoA hydratase echA12 n=1 Tax=Corynebacterium provencense TaxID=1737425 RepID=A0A2Z3YW01_9CORY|nr:enoyl-CoA hydratase/isomerase family protein [Corynebacterium provencense]AWT26744.1 putative enoyl-CoA hydratase echA12 [Corynebacterium provencense]
MTTPSSAVPDTADATDATASAATFVTVQHDAYSTSIEFTGALPGNRLTYAGMLELIAALQEAHRENRTLLVLSASGPDFCVGRDQQEHVTGLSRPESLSLILRVNELLTAFPGVTICAVHGHALGFGSGLATQSDFTVAEQSAIFGFDEITKGLAPLVVAEYLPTFVGVKQALDLVLSGRLLDAQEAVRLGIVNRLVPEGSLIGATDRLRDQLSLLEPGALRLLKSYSRRLRTGAITHPGEAAVRELDQWLSSGRPENPDTSSKA